MAKMPVNKAFETLSTIADILRRPEKVDLDTLRAAGVLLEGALVALLSDRLELAQQAVELHADYVAMRAGRLGELSPD